MMPDIAPTPPEMRRPTKLIVDRPINRLTEHNIHVYSAQPREAINSRIKELEKEWSIERIIEAGASLFAILGIALGAFVSAWWLIIPAIISALFLMHATMRFSSSLSFLQGRGTRTDCEIAAETFAMKLLRGDGPSSATDRAALADKVIEETRAFSSID